jgi:hypothetical protein
MNVRSRHWRSHILLRQVEEDVVRVSDTPVPRRTYQARRMAFLGVFGQHVGDSPDGSISINVRRHSRSHILVRPLEEDVV